MTIEVDERSDSDINVFDRRTQIILYLRHSFIITVDRYRPGVK